MKESEKEVSQLKKQLETKEGELQKAEELRKQLEQASTSLTEKNNAMKESEKEVSQLKKQLKTKECELQKAEELRKQLEQASTSLTEKNAEAKAASQEAELISLQLHQVQEELEYYFCSSRAKDELIQKHQAQQQRMKKLISKVLIAVEHYNV